MDVWTKDHPFPIDIDYMISDTLELLRPKMRLSCSLDEATKQVADLEREVLVKLGKDGFPDSAAGFSGSLPEEQHSLLRRRAAGSAGSLKHLHTKSMESPEGCSQFTGFRNNRWRLNSITFSDLFRSVASHKAVITFKNGNNRFVLAGNFLLLLESVNHQTFSTYQ